MNSIITIAPYKWNGLWVFDDEAVGLRREAFVSGADTLIDTLVEQKQIKNPHNGFILQFSNSPFPDFDIHVKWEEGDTHNMTGRGNNYIESKSGHKLWLCPALFCYFKVAPRNIFVLAKPIPTISQRGAANNKKRKERQYASKKERP